VADAAPADLARLSCIGKERIRIAHRLSDAVDDLVDANFVASRGVLLKLEDDRQ
jgi:hypothetical protein